MTYGREVKINVGGGLVSTRGCWLEDVNAAKSIGGGGVYWRGTVTIGAWRERWA